MEIDYSKELLNHMTPFGFEIKIVDIIIIIVTITLVIGTIALSLFKYTLSKFLIKKKTHIEVKTFQEIRKFPP